MKNVLHELYNGHLSRDSMTFEKGTPYARALDSMVNAENDLLTSLSEEQKKAFEADPILLKPWDPMGSLAL